MNTLTINSKAHEVLARATERARTEKPLVRKTATYGVYEVRSSSNPSLWYTVTCNSEAKAITCNCPAKKPCKHLPAVLPLHVYIARQKRDEVAAALAAAEVEAAGWPVPAETSEVPSFDAEAAPVAAPADQDFTAQVEEIRTICTATTAQLAETERLYADLIPSFDGEYTAAQADHDRECLFG